jgi:hypothetical protein
VTSSVLAPVFPLFFLVLRHPFLQTVAHLFSDLYIPLYRSLNALCSSTIEPERPQTSPTLPPCFNAFATDVLEAFCAYIYHYTLGFPFTTSTRIPPRHLHHHTYNTIPHRNQTRIYDTAFILIHSPLFSFPGSLDFSSSSFGVMSFSGTSSLAASADADTRCDRTQETSCEPGGTDGCLASPRNWANCRMDIAVRVHPGWPSLLGVPSRLVALRSFRRPPASFVFPRRSHSMRADRILALRSVLKMSVRTDNSLRSRTSQRSSALGMVEIYHDGFLWHAHGQLPSQPSTRSVFAGTF